MSIGRHHQSLRRRLYKNLEPYPHPKLLQRVLDKTIFAIGFLGPAFTIPQISNIYIDHNTGGVAVLTWSAYALLDIPWVLYGLVHKERAITFTYTLWFIANTAVAIGAFFIR